MCRDYVMMRKMMSTVAKSDNDKLMFKDFTWAFDRRSIVTELKRLGREGLIDSTLEFEGYEACVGGEVTGLTDEGREFWNLIENDSVWKPILETLEKARIDLSYPMLKDVCEEIVRRYVAKFIPDRP